MSERPGVRPLEHEAQTGEEARAGEESGPPARRSRRSGWRRPLRWTAIALALALVVLVGWAALPRGPDEDRFTTVFENPRVAVGQGDGYLRLTPEGEEPVRGVVFYPGARVAPASYAATWAPVVAEAGVAVFIPAMPLNFAVLDIDRADEVIAAEDTIESWIVGGHSLGGAMASSHLGRRAEATAEGHAATDGPAAVDRIEGLVLWGGYPTEGAELAARDDLAVLSVAGGRDGLTTTADVRQRRHLLPDDADVVVIDGMNHAQFGAYGDHWRDGEALISDGEAADELAEVTASWLAERSSRRRPPRRRSRAPRTGRSRR
ncbi:alpha/beta hydrolase [Egibacter rhizosphaerae]|uniref:Alpha/beta hydrolase n=1 Tax=Egibacter rhizosphaerae TaxID=1670831 RepID=A0A411YHI8_9ACTN|nr:alpha/beta hydrolase [Egibacter rhizosphaerae]QBI20579.1 alpha/beta hydrolase [Egibacter rhizosphaerae]